MKATSTLGTGGESKSAPTARFGAMAHPRDDAFQAGHLTRPTFAPVSYQNFSKASTSLSDELWSILDEVIVLNDCDVYTYLSGLSCEQAGAGGNDDDGDDPFSELGCLCSFNYFFMNKKLKRVLYFSCRSISKTAGIHGLRNASSNAMRVQNYHAPASYDIDFEDVDDDALRRNDDDDDDDKGHDEMFFADEDVGTTTT